MWDGGMSTSKVKRGLSSFLSRSSANQPLASLARTSAPNPQPPSPAIDPSPTESAPPSDQQLLQMFRKHLSYFEQMHVVDDVELSDARVCALRRDVEHAMPRLHAICADPNAGPLKTDARLVKKMANIMLQKFPDVVGESRAESNDIVPSHSQSRSASFDSGTASSLSRTLPPPSPSGTVSSPRQAQSAHASPRASVDSEAEGRVEHGQKSASDTMTDAQRTLLVAVHDLLATSGGLIMPSRSWPAWLEAPAAKSPGELQALQPPGSLPRGSQHNVRHTQVAGQTASHLRSAAQNPYSPYASTTPVAHRSPPMQTHRRNVSRDFAL